ncbi:hypothetical protein IKE87_00725 [Candidatus Saccharibacteria bacterium]|nr:hypothetical protein [Candidatus Saccharibacteria bacterium]
MVTINIKTQFVLVERALRYEKVKEFFEIKDEFTKVPIDSIVLESEDYPLHEVLPETVRIIRDSGQPGFVLKKDGKLFCTTHPHVRRFQARLDGIKTNGIHKCSEKDMICRRLSALSDAEGGCAKIRDEDFAIEKYPFITEGYEFFNINQNCFVVLGCQHWIPNYNANATPKLQQKDVSSRKLAIAQYVWPEVKTISDLKKKLQK